MSEIADRYVYVINDEFGVPCYIGKGKGRRLNDHISEAKNGRKNSNIAKFEYFADCIKRGIILVAYKVAEELTSQEAYSYEDTLVAWYGRRDLHTGCLFNMRSGGFGGRDPSPKSREKISRKQKERFALPGQRERLSINARKQFESTEARKAQSERLSEVWKSEELRAEASVKLRKKLAESEIKSKMIDYWARPESRTQASAKHKGKKASLETRKKQSEAANRRWASAEARLEYGNKSRGKKASVETKKKMSMKIRAWWASPAGEAEKLRRKQNSKLKGK